MNMRELEAAMGMSRPAVSAAVRKLHAQRLVFVKKWDGNGYFYPSYKAGCEDDEERPESSRSLVSKAIADKALEAAAVAVATGLSEQTVRGALKALHSEKLAHVASWIVDRGPHSKEYRLGAGEDAAKPAIMTNAEKVKRYKNTEKGKKVCRKCRIRWRRSRNGKEYERKRGASRWARISTKPKA